MGGGTGPAQQQSNKIYLTKLSQQTRDNGYEELYTSSSLNVQQNHDPKTTLIPAFFPARVSDYPADLAMNEEITSIVVMLDCTASMGPILEQLIKNVLKDYFPDIYTAGIPHPQIAFVAIGDALDQHSSQYTPVQMTQFESSAEKVTEALMKISLDCCKNRGGGHNGVESYDLGVMALLDKVNLQCFDKSSGNGAMNGLSGNGDARWQAGQARRKGLFISIGDDGIPAHLEAHHIKKYINQQYLGVALSKEQLWEKLQEKFVVKHIHIDGHNDTDGYYNRAKQSWESVLPGHVEITKRDNQGNINVQEFTQLLVSLTTSACLETNLIKEEVLKARYEALTHHEKNQEGIPVDFLCPISGELMVDPVQTMGGHTYERANIERWFASGKSTDPKTGGSLSDRTLIENHSLRAMIRALPKPEKKPAEQAVRHCDAAAANQIPVGIDSPDRDNEGDTTMFNRRS